MRVAPQSRHPIFQCYLLEGTKLCLYIQYIEILLPCNFNSPPKAQFSEVVVPHFYIKNILDIFKHYAGPKKVL